MNKQIPKTLIVGISVTVIILLMVYLFTKLPAGGEKHLLNRFHTAAPINALHAISVLRRILLISSQLAQWQKRE